MNQRCSTDGDRGREDPSARTAADATDVPWPAGDSASARLVRERDWSRSPLGPVARWPTMLRSAVEIVLAARQPMQVVWGAQLLAIYNDAFAQVCGDKHPLCFGQPLAEVWSEVWPQMRPRVEEVLAGQALWVRDMEVSLEGRSGVSAAWFSYSWTPLRDDDGKVAGFLCVVTETTQEHLAKEALAVATQRQRQWFEQAPGFIAILRGPEHEFEFANEAYRRLSGGRDLIGRTVREALPEVESQGFLQLLDRVYATGERYVASRVPVQLGRPGAGSAELYLDFIYAPVLDEHGKVNGIFVEGHDVTDALLAQRAVDRYAQRQGYLAQLSERLTGATDLADLSYIAGEILGRALDTGRAGYGTIDPVRETITIERDWNAPGIRSLAGTLQFRDYGTYIEDLKRGQMVVIADARQDPRTLETAAALEAISARSVVNVPIMEQGRFVALLYVNQATEREWTTEERVFIREVGERTRAVVERRRAERQLRELAQSLERQVGERTAERDRVWQNSRDLLVVIGKDGVFRRVNPAWKTILGHEPAEIVGVSFLDLVWPEDIEMSRRAIATASSEGDLTGFENRYRTKDGEPRWISWHTSVEGDLIYGYGRDITSEKAQAEALRQTQELLLQAQKMEAVGQLTGGIAHDFNNLLVGITGSLDMLDLRVGQGRTQELGRYIDAARGAAQRAAALTHRLLAFSRRQTLDPHAIDMNRLVVGLEELVRRTVGPEIAVTVRPDPELWTTFADPHQLENALLNLCINARDAMPRGGKVVIETANRRLDKQAADPRGLPPGAYVSLCVSDTGIGMSPEVMARAFDPFYTTKPLGTGTGLGLSMIYGFTKQSGGQVRIHSAPGQGTSVCIYLPRHEGEADADAVAPASADALAAQVGQTVLLVDDESTVRMLVGEILEDRGYRVLAAAEGAGALDILQSDAQIDLLVTDVGLPGGINGRQLADAARVYRPALKVLFITGYAQGGVVGDGQLEPGMQLLTKPFAVQELAARVGELIAAEPR